MNLKDKIKKLREESDLLIIQVRNNTNYLKYDEESKIIDKKIASLKRRCLYLYKKVTGDKIRKFKCIVTVLDALDKVSVQKEK